jgi:dolichyl-phosphate-mannose--protein O-mannosyl transferase
VTTRRLVPVGLLLLAALLRFAGLGSPPQLMFDEAHYATDACTYVQTDGCGVTGDGNVEHPPLGKWLIASGIATFGYDAFGWRVMSAIAGSLSVLFLYMLAVRLTASMVIASVAAGLMALDPLHLVQSRVAMLDIFVLAFGLAALVCAHVARSSGSAWWLAGLGVTGGAAAACKWSGIIFLLLGAVFYVRGGGPVRSGLARAGALAVLVYVLSYIGRVDSVASFFSHQADMWSFHSGLDYQHPYASPPWSWVLLQRPVAYLFATTTHFVGEGEAPVSEVLATGNPLTWWPAVISVGYCIWAWIRGRASSAMRWAATGFVATFGVWLLFSPFRSATFLFYMVPVLPFMYLALAATAVRWRPGPLVAAVVAVGSFLFLWPVLSGQEISRAAWHRRMVFEDCAGPGRTAEMAATPLIGAHPGGAPAPPGWCWI